MALFPKLSFALLHTTHQKLKTTELLYIANKVKTAKAMQMSQQNKRFLELDMYNILTHSPVAICIFRSNQYIIDFANDSYLQILGKTSDIVDKPFFDSFPELENQGIKETFEQVMESGQILHVNEYEVFLMNDGLLKQHYFNCIYQPLKSADGVSIGIMVVFTEVTDLILAKKMNIENQKTLTIELNIAHIELAFQKEEKGKRAAELGIANIELAFQDDEKGKRAAELGIANIELAFQDDEKEKRAAELDIANIELAFQNREKEKREIANKELQAAKTQAENATKIAEDAVKAKQQFLSNMSHEIRTPMNAIIGFTKVVLKTDLSAKQKEYLMAIKMSGDALIVLINDILDLAKVDAGKMTFEKTPFKLALSISAMLHLFETKIQEKNLKLVKEYDNRIPEVLMGDPVRLHQIILNLVSNAVKFTSEGTINVQVVLLHEDDEQVTIEFAVTDTGIGISEDKIAKIFDNFQQASSNTARLFGGTGLGLAIVKQLVEPQGGAITVKSTIDKGSTFSFTLSFQKTNAKAESDTETMALSPDISNIKVLVVEDMPLNQLLMKTVLDDFGFERDIANNGRIAIEKLTQKDAYGAIKVYDIILMDLQMPEMNGFEATEYIRNTLKSKIPIIALTADVTTVDVAKCKAVGMNDYIAKPIDERVLYNKIVGLVKKNVVAHTNKANKIEKQPKLRCTNLNYLMQRTKSNPILMQEMIVTYLEQTPVLISQMKQSVKDEDWQLLNASLHKMIPSFLIMGISTDFENMAKKVMEYTQTQKQTATMLGFVTQIENVCLQACEELKDELNTIKDARR